MGASSSKPAAYPLPIPGQPSYGASQSSWSVIGNNKKGRGRSNSDGYFLAMPNPTGYAYPVQPYPYCTHPSSCSKAQPLIKKHQMLPKAIRAFIILRLEVSPPPYLCPNRSQT